jgi:hypothetical protein
LTLQLLTGRRSWSALLFGVLALAGCGRPDDAGKKPSLTVQNPQVHVRKPASSISPAGTTEKGSAGLAGGTQTPAARASTIPAAANVGSAGNLPQPGGVDRLPLVQSTLASPASQKQAETYTTGVASPTPSGSPAPADRGGVAGAKRWTIPGGSFMLPDWTPVQNVIEKGQGIIAVSRIGAQPGGVSLAWSYQPDPIAPRDLATIAPAYLGILRSILQDDQTRTSSLEPPSESELDVVGGHAAVRIRVRIKEPGALEGSLVVWDCAESHRTFAFFCYAPSKSIASQLVYAICKYASCHDSPVTFDDSVPLTFEPPSGWKNVVRAPNQLIFSSPDEASAVYLVSLAVSEANNITPKVTAQLLDTLGQLVGRLVHRGEPQMISGASLGHDVGRVRAEMKIDQRNASGIFEFWVCPKKHRIFARILLAKLEADTDKLRPCLDKVRCH